MSSEAWVGVASLAFMLVAALLGGACKWMFDVHGKLSSIEQKLETLGEYRTSHDARMDNHEVRIRAMEDWRSRTDNRTLPA